MARRNPKPLTASIWACLAAGGWIAGCIANAPEGISRQTDGGGGGGPDFTTSISSSVTTGPENNDPHAVFAATPPHGPFDGGTRVIVDGKGFTSEVRVWFGDVEATTVVPIGPSTLQVDAPPGPPGPVDLTTQNGEDTSTRRVLTAGFSYDALYAEPNEGPVAGGTVIRIFGSGTDWTSGFIGASVDNAPCTTVDVISSTEVACTVPKGTPGTKAIQIETEEGQVSALDAFTYQDSSDGFKGGLSGEAIDGELRVIAYDNFSGDPIPGAHVILGDDAATVRQTDETGVVLRDDAGDQPVTVTIAAECHSPITFAHVPVDTVTAYLDPVLTPQCAGEGDPPPGGGTPILTGLVSGELVWPGTQEFQKGEWSNVPNAGPGQERVAYLYYATRNRNQAFTPASSSFQVRETAEGGIGYGFTIYGFPGSQILYAVAGLRNTSNGTFTAYAFGSAGTVAINPGETTGPVYIDMVHAMDQALTLNVSPPPSNGAGPDRMDARTILELAPSRYAPLPNMTKQPLLPLGGPIEFVGLPPLDGGLTGARYRASAAAVTGPSGSAPLSVVGDASTTTTSLPIVVDGFVAVPELTTPASNTVWNGRDLGVDHPLGGFPVEMTVYEITAAGGLWNWIVAVPGGSHDLRVPDLTGFEDAHLPSGPLVIGIYGARYEAFDYGQLGYRELRPRGMDAYAFDFFDVLY